MSQTGNPNRGSLPDRKRNKKDFRAVMSQKQEKTVASFLNGSTTPGSKRGDVELYGVDKNIDSLVECKVTGKKQITIKRSYLEKITKEAYDKDALPQLLFGFDSDDCENHWMAVPLSSYKRTRKRLQVYQKQITQLKLKLDRIKNVKEK